MFVLVFVFESEFEFVYLLEFEFVYLLEYLEIRYCPFAMRALSLSELVLFPDSLVFFWSF